MIIWCRRSSANACYVRLCLELRLQQCAANCALLQTSCTRQPRSAAAPSQNQPNLLLLSAGYLTTSPRRCTFPYPPLPPLPRPSALLPRPYTPFRLCLRHLLPAWQHKLFILSQRESLPRQCTLRRRPPLRPSLCSSRLRLHRSLSTLRCRFPSPCRSASTPTWSRATSRRWSWLPRRNTGGEQLASRGAAC